MTAPVDLRSDLAVKPVPKNCKKIWTASSNGGNLLWRVDLKYLDVLEHGTRITRFFATAEIHECFREVDE